MALGASGVDLRKRFSVFNRKSAKNSPFGRFSFSKQQLIVFSLMFAAVGGYALYRTFAAEPSLYLEPEMGTLTAPAIIGDDVNASGGKYVQFGTVAPPPPPEEGETFTIAAAGDVGHDGGTSGQAATGNLIRTINPDYVLMLGDGAYGEGTLSQFQTRYDPYWGSFKSKTKPVPGNHEQRDSDRGYDAYFGAGFHNYTWTAGNWRFVGLDTNDGDATSLSYLNSVPVDKPCMVVYFHHPWHSSGSAYRGGISGVKALNEAARAKKYDLILNGHEHNYERFAKTNANKTADPDGYRPIVSGGGGRSLRGFSTIDPQSEVRISKFGVLKLDLKNSSYSGEWMATDGTRSAVPETNCNVKS